MIVGSICHADSSKLHTNCGFCKRQINHGLTTLSCIYLIIDKLFQAPLTKSELDRFISAMGSLSKNTTVKTKTYYRSFVLSRRLEHMSGPFCSQFASII